MRAYHSVIVTRRTVLIRRKWRPAQLGSLVLSTSSGDAIYNQANGVATHQSALACRPQHAGWPAGTEPKMTQLPPAYRGAPYYQPPRPPLKRRAARIIRVLAIAALVLAVIILIGAAVAPAAWP